MSISVATLLSEMVLSQQAHRLGKSADVNRYIAVASQREATLVTKQVNAALPTYSVQILNLGNSVEIVGYSSTQPPKSPTSGYFRLILQVIPVEGT